MCRKPVGEGAKRVTTSGAEAEGAVMAGVIPPAPAVHSARARISGFLQEQLAAQALRWRLVGMDRLSRAQSETISDDSLRNNGRNKARKQELPALFSKPFVQIVATALDEGKTSMRRMASILDIAIDDFGELFAAHAVNAPYEL